MAALAAASLQSVSFGHQHLEGDALLHHHFYFGAHEHHDHGRDHHHDHGAPALGQPVCPRMVLTPLEKLSPVLQALALPLVARPVARLTSPRAPPLPLSPLRVS